MIVDSHNHLWHIGTSDLYWLSPDMRDAGGPIVRDFLVQDLKAAFATVGVHRSVLVHAWHAKEDNLQWLEVAEANEVIGAVVTWLDLTNPSVGETLDRFFARTRGITRIVHASEVWESIHSGGKYFVVDVRPAEEYAKGHVPGAISIPIDSLFRPASLERLPPAGGKPILLVCRSGHTESMALGGLAALGYEPYVMQFGMIGWNAQTMVKAGSPRQAGDAVRGLGGPIEKASGSGLP